MEKYIWFNNLKFTRDDKTGYYLNSTIRERLHRYIWRFYNGDIPDGYDVHHKDGDKSHNDIDNYELLLSHDHQVEHGYRLTQKERDWRRNNCNENARPKAIEWHKSEEGRKWHSKHWKECCSNTEPQAFICQYCGDSFQSKPNGNNKFCSNKCKSAWRRGAGLDNEIRKCKFCGKEFAINKYSKTKTCSKTCSNRLYPRLPQLRNNDKNHH